MERVLCVKSKDLWDQLGNFSGYRPITNPYRGVKTDYDLIFGGACEMAWLLKDTAESDPSWKQLIPYVVFGHLAVQADHHITTGEPYPAVYDIFHYTRMKGQGEKRLHGKISIGVGGHINPLDIGQTSPDEPVIKMFDPKTAYVTGLRRELDEELHNRHDHWQEPKLRGLIYDPTTPVGEVHLGLVHTILLEHREEISPKDPNMGEPDWHYPEQLMKMMTDLEGWTQILVPHLPSLFN